MRMLSRLPGGLAILAIALSGASPTVATEFTATSLSGGTWENSANWNVTPGGSLNGYPDNVGADVFDVSIPSSVSFNLNGNITVRDLTIANGVTFQNASNRILRVERNASISNASSVNSSLQIELLGATTSSGTVALTNGSSVLNTGSLNVVGSGGSLGFEASEDLRSLGYTFRNEGTTTINRPGATSLFHHNVMQNAGVLDVVAGAVGSLNGFTQSADTTIVRNGASMSGNNFAFNGGAVFGSGAAFSVSSFALNGATLEIGETVGTADSLTIAGNVSNPVNAILAIDLGGLAQGTTYDHLILPNGTGLGGATLDIELLGGFTPTVTDTFTIMTGTNFNGQFANDVGGTIFASGFGTFSVTYAPTSVVLGGFVPVPEPSLVASASLALVCLVALRRRVKRVNRARTPATPSQQ